VNDVMDSPKSEESEAPGISHEPGSASAISRYNEPNFNSQQLMIRNGLKDISEDLAGLFYSYHWSFANKWPLDWKAHVAVSARALLGQFIESLLPKHFREEQAYLEARNYVEKRVHESEKFDINTANDSKKFEIYNKINRRTDVYYFLLKTRPEITKEKAYKHCENWGAIVGGLNPIVHKQVGGIEKNIDTPLENTETILLEYFFKNEFFRKTKIIDSLMLEPNPVVADLQRLKILFVSPSLEDYFFARCKNFAWLELLINDGFFKELPETVTNEKGSFYIRWQKMRYLLAIADKQPKEVMDLILRLEKITNPLIIEDVVQIALLIPSQHAKRVITLIKSGNWQKIKYSGLLQYKLGDLVTKLSDEKEFEAAWELATIMLDFECDPPLEWENGMRFPNDAKSSYDPWVFESILKDHILPLNKIDANRLLELMLNSLNAALNISYRSSNVPDVVEDKDYDGSAIWRRDLVEMESHHRSDYNNELVSAIVETLRHIAENKSASVDVTNLIDLNSFKFDIFK